MLFQLALLRISVCSLPACVFVVTSNITVFFVAQSGVERWASRAGHTGHQRCTSADLAQRPVTRSRLFVNWQSWGVCTWPAKSSTGSQHQHDSVHPGRCGWNPYYDYRAVRMYARLASRAPFEAMHQDAVGGRPYVCSLRLICQRGTRRHPIFKACVRG